MRNHRCWLSPVAGLGGNGVGMVGRAVRALLGPALALALAGCSGAIVNRLAETCPQVCRGSGMEQCGPVLVSTANLETFCSCCAPDSGPAPRQAGGRR
jgi:hypothetical protein